MGPRMKLPPYVHAFVDRHGNPPFYFRRAGFKKVPLPGLPWSPEFMAAYQGTTDAAPRIEIGARRSAPGSVGSAVASYLASWTFQKLAPETRRTRKNILE